MSHLIELFKQDFQLAGYTKRSIQSYTSSVLRLQRFYNKPLEDTTEEQLRQYWLCCQSEFGWSESTLRISYFGIQHFFQQDACQAGKYLISSARRSAMSLLE